VTSHLDGPAFPRDEEPVLARFRPTLANASGESDHPLTQTRTIGSPRQGQWRLAAAYARSDRLTLGVLGAHPSKLRSMSSTIRRGRDPGHALLHPQEGGASRNCSVRGVRVVRCPPEATARRPTATSRRSTCASSGRCSRPPAHGGTAECEALQQRGSRRPENESSRAGPGWRTPGSERALGGRSPANRSLPTQRYGRIRPLTHSG
jgi:hypothetical protein